MTLRAPLAALASLLFLATASLADVSGSSQAVGGAQDDARTTNCRKDDRAAHCRALCTPAKMVFLPCMAVGAPAMPACREREIRACLSACAARGGTSC